MGEEEEVAQVEHPGTKLPEDAQIGSNIFTRENIDGILDRGIGTYHAIDAIRRMIPHVPRRCTARDLLFMIESVSTEGDFIEETFITFFVDCLGIIRREFSAAEEDEELEKFPLTADFIADRLSDLQPVEGAEFTFNFTSFFVRGAEITSVEAIVSFDALLMIQLKQNLIADLSPFAQLPRLKHLDLTENKVRTIPALRFPSLEALILAKNQLSAIEGLNCPSLKTFSAAGNHIFFIAPYAFRQCPNLEVLNLATNGIRNFGELCFEGLKRLKVLKLQENPFQSIAPAMSRDFEALTDLDISDTQISKLYGLDRAPNIEVLDVHKTALEQPLDFSGLTPEPKIKYLYIFETPLAEYENVKLELIHIMPLLEEIDEQAVTIDDRQESFQLFEEKAEAERRMIEELLGQTEGYGNGEEEEGQTTVYEEEPQQEDEE
jgi:hypothetical protein